jgi:hypothetical protein
MNMDWNGSEIDMLKAVYYKLMGEGQFGPAQAIVQTLFEITSESEVDWGLFWPAKDSWAGAAIRPGPLT